MQGTDGKKAEGSAKAQVQPVSVRSPDPLKLGSDPQNAWKIWKQLWTNYAIVADLDNEARPEGLKKAVLISVMGAEALQIYNGCDPKDDDTAEEIVTKMDTFIIGEVNEIFERYRFNSRYQLPNENIDAFVGALKSLAKSCNFCTCLGKTLLRDRIVIGISDETTRQRLLQERNLTLENCQDICRAYESTSNQMGVISKASGAQAVSRSEDVHHISKQPSGDRRYSDRQKPERRENGNMINKCKFCAGSHPRAKEMCRAWGKKCSRCQGDNHFARCCPAEKPSSVRKVHSVHRNDASESEDDEECIFGVQSEVHSISSGPIYAEMQILDGQKVKFQVDCGATVNVIPASLIGDTSLKPSETRLNMYNKSVIKPKGKCKLAVKNPVTGHEYRVQFQVIEEELVPLLSRSAAEKMELITVNYEGFQQVHSVEPEGNVADLLAGYKNVFDDTTIGDLPGPVTLKIDDTIKPTQCPPRRVPLAVKPALERELERLVALGVIRPVTEPTAWCSQLSIQKKRKGKLRLCSDPKPLNEALVRERYPLPTMEDVTPQLAQAKIFSKVDLSHGYWHCELDEKSSFLTTFITPYGRFRWLRLPFGTKVSSEIFQRKLNEALEGLDGVICVADDVLIYGQNKEQHKANLLRLLKRCEERKIVLNRDKCEIGIEEVTYNGHVVSKDGLKPDKGKLDAILKMPNPTSVEEVRRLQGMVNYLARFLPKLSTVMEPIRRLTHKGTIWQWSQEQEEAMEKIKQMVTQTPILAYYDPNKELTIQCDASSTGLGAALLQETRPVGYASRALTSMESGYAQIEKECLAIVFAVEKFHEYTFDRTTTVHSDHKPLEAIVRKPLSRTPKRIQGMLLRLLQYDLEVVYKKGSEMFLADTLSRAYLQAEKKDADQFASVNAVLHLRVSQDRLKELREATRADETMTVLKNVILQGWPENRQNLPAQITPYRPYCDELGVQDGLIFKGERIVVPVALRTQMKEHLHKSHLGTDSMLRRARECLFWPGMAGDIKQVGDNCEACQTFSNAQQKETLMAIKSNAPWQKVGVDLFSYNGTDYLLTIDHFSNYWEIDRLRNTEANIVIVKLKHHFARFGIPMMLISDNGPQFTAGEFRQFAREWDFEQFTSSPGHPQANGKAESGVKAAKMMLKKCRKCQEDPLLALLEIRNTPTQGTSASPALRLLNRRTRSLLPMTADLLVPRGTEYTRIDRPELQSNPSQRPPLYKDHPKR